MNVDDGFLEQGPHDPLLEPHVGLGIVPDLFEVLRQTEELIR